jgi:hypothetical protein
MSAKAAGRTKKRKPGIGGDRFVAVLRGSRYYVVDQNGLTMGGPYPDRGRAQEQADLLNRNLGW